MPTLSYAVGPHEMVSIIGHWIPPSQMLAIDQRPGVAGTEITELAIKGEPFQILSQVDQVSYQQALQTFKEYQALKDGDAVDLKIAGIQSSSLGFLVSVLDVKPQQIRPLSSAMGRRLNHPSLAWLECIWTLIAIQTQTEA